MKGTTLATDVHPQITVEGGTTVVGLLALAAFFVATILSVLVTYRFVQGYRRSRAMPILFLAVGMFLLAPAPMFVRFVVGNVVAVPSAVRILTTSLLESAGLLTILVVVYGGGR
jgi:hypothetical protein